MLKRLIVLVILVFSFYSSIAQEAWIKGWIKAEKDAEPLVGVNILINGKAVAVSDVRGNYLLSVDTGKLVLTFRMVGYTEESRTVQPNKGDTLTVDVALTPFVSVFNTVVVSAGRYEQKLSDVMVSLDVIKPSLVSAKNTTSLEQVVEQVPGVSVTDGQTNIRGGSGYSYGAGSRVLLLVDDLPMLTADASDIKWSFLPVENLEQVEVMKGASSVLFGSSALNGVINLRTAYPRDTPSTQITCFTGIYDHPKRRELQWWNNTAPTQSGMSISHSQKIKQLDLVLGANSFSDAGYRQLEDKQRIRGNANLRYRFSKIRGLFAGVNVNYMEEKGGLFILWKDADSGAYRPSGGSLQRYTNTRAAVDPFITYRTASGSKHSLRSRYFHTNNSNDTHQSSVSDLYYTEYQYQRRTGQQWTYTFGATHVLGKVRAAELYGNHSSRNISVYGQVDKKWEKIAATIGLRTEYFKVDAARTEKILTVLGKTKKLPFYPVFRAGLNYHAAEYTYVRASFGQGYRFPSVAEKYISTTVGGLKIFPNTRLQPETGWSAEIGIKQGVQVKDWKAYIDIAAFWMEYQHMMEFAFGYYFPDSIQHPTLSTYLNSAGFKSMNIGNTRISGAELSITGQGNIGPLQTTVLAGYTYTNPINLNKKADTTASSEVDILKYRYYHAVRGDIQFDYKRWMLGLSARYNSFVINIDRKFEQPLFSEILPTVPIYILPGLKEYREKHNKGVVVCDGRIGFRISTQVKLSFVVNNVLNGEYMDRPGNIRAPRLFVLQLNCKL